MPIIILRDIEERDIDDRIRRFTVETAWGDRDAPDEAFGPIDYDGCSHGAIGNRPHDRR